MPLRPAARPAAAATRSVAFPREPCSLCRQLGRKPARLLHLLPLVAVWLLLQLCCAAVPCAPLALPCTGCRPRPLAAPLSVNRALNFGRLAVVFDGGARVIARKRESRMRTLV